MRDRIDSRSVLIGLTTTFVTVCLGAWYGIGALFTDILFDARLAPAMRRDLLLSLITGGFTDGSTTDIVYLWALAILIGSNVTLISAYLRSYRRLEASLGL